MADYQVVKFNLLIIKALAHSVFIYVHARVL